MKFHSYVTEYDKARIEGLRHEIQIGEFYLETLKYLSSNLKQTEENASYFQGVSSEFWWYHQMRPYWKVYPSITKDLLKFNLDVDISALNIRETAILIRLAEGHEINCGNDTIETILVHNGDVGISITNSCCNGGKASIAFSRHGTLVDVLTKNKQSDLGIVSVALKLTIMCLLIADDPNIIQPDVLSKDRQRFDNSTNPAERQRLIDKAKKRGVVGFRIGEQYESIPHYRRPHPALYHVGKGRTEQRIVFRSGCVVHRDKMTKVPTGYITPEGVEVEP